MHKNVKSRGKRYQSDQEEERPLLEQCSYSHTASQLQDCWFQRFIQSTVHASQCATSGCHAQRHLNKKESLFPLGA